MTLMTSSDSDILANNMGVIVIVGQTGSGKSALAMELAKKFDGEIICADSRTVYKGMDIGTAKPNREEQARIPHHLLDIVTPDLAFSAADFQKHASEAIADIQNRGKLPIIVGGTGLYVDALLYDFSFSGPDSARDATNPRHAKKDMAGLRHQLRPNTLILGLETEKEEIDRRIELRVEQMLQAGLRQEANVLAKQYGWDAPGLNAIGYREWRQEDKSTQEIIVEIIRNTKNYAKRQRTWFKRNRSIQWVKEQGKAVDIATTFLYKS